MELVVFSMCFYSSCVCLFLLFPLVLLLDSSAAPCTSCFSSSSSFFSFFFFSSLVYFCHEDKHLVGSCRQHSKSINKPANTCNWSMPHRQTIYYPTPNGNAKTRQTTTSSELCPWHWHGGSRPQVTSCDVRKSNPLKPISRGLLTLLVHPGDFPYFQAGCNTWHPTSTGPRIDASRTFILVLSQIVHLLF